MTARDLLKLKNEMRFIIFLYYVSCTYKIVNNFHQCMLYNRIDTNV